MNKRIIVPTFIATHLLLVGNVAAQEQDEHQHPAEPVPKEQQNDANQQAAPEHDHSRHVPEPPPAPASEPHDHSAKGHEHDTHRTPDQPATPIPEPTDADRAAAVRPRGGHAMHDNALQRLVLIDHLEVFETDGGSGLEWDAQASLGTDINKLWLRSEGERVGSNLEDADLEVLYGRSFARWWDVVAGIRHHFEPGGSQDMAVIGVMGVAPYKFEVDASLYIGSSGYTGARLEVEYETLLTNRLVLQPAIEVNVHGQDDPAHGNGSGLGTVEAGLRLRYEFTRRFAPYIGIVHERAYGRTADFRREDGEDINDTRLVAGVRTWF